MQTWPDPEKKLHQPIETDESVPQPTALLCCSDWLWVDTPKPLTENKTQDSCKIITDERLELICLFVSQTRMIKNLATWHFPGGPDGPSARWAATQNV